MTATVPEIIKMFYNCGCERQTFACRLLMPINAGLPPSSEGLPLSCEGPLPSSVLLPPCCMVWRGTRKRRHQGGITVLWDCIPTLRDGRPTLWDGRPTLCEGRPALRDAMGWHGALWDGRPTLWDDRPTLYKGRPALRDAIGRHGAFPSIREVSELIFIFRGMVMFLSQRLWVELVLNGDAALCIHFATPRHLAGLFRSSAAP